jgi:2-hydroxychromene-2-carboxylate isomerase
MERVEFFFDLGSPWSYLASTQLDGLAERTGASVIWRPFLLGGVFKATGNRSPVYEEVESKRAYLYEDLPAWAAFYEIPFRIPSEFPPNTLTAMRAVVGAARLGRLVPFVRAAFAAYFADDENISDIEVVARVAARSGIDANEIRSLVGDPEIKEALKRATAEAVARGAFGAPTFFWRDRMFFGNDRLTLLEGLIRRT